MMPRHSDTLMAGGMLISGILSRGWSIFPCGRDKRPLVASWKPYQSERAGREQILAWQINLRPATWALVTGAVSDLITLDFDGQVGVELMRKLNLSPHRRTPSGGAHVDLRYPGHHVKTLNFKSTSELGSRWPGLDIRADGGYVCIAGRTERGAYVWTDTNRPREIASLPADLAEYLGLLNPA
jgi:hypothetical protein